MYNRTSEPYKEKEAIKPMDIVIKLEERRFLYQIYMYYTSLLLRGLQGSDHF